MRCGAITGWRGRAVARRVQAVNYLSSSLLDGDICHADNTADRAASAENCGEASAGGRWCKAMAAMLRCPFYPAVLFISDHDKRRGRQASRGAEDDAS